MRYRIVRGPSDQSNPVVGSGTVTRSFVVSIFTQERIRNLDEVRRTLERGFGQMRGPRRTSGSREKTFSLGCCLCNCGGLCGIRWSQKPHQVRISTASLSPGSVKCSHPGGHLVEGPGRTSGSERRDENRFANRDQWGVRNTLSWLLTRFAAHGSPGLSCGENSPGAPLSREAAVVSRGKTAFRFFMWGERLFARGACYELLARRGNSTWASACRR